jgi:putative ABC transport system ATP-binding protein
MTIAPGEVVALFGPSGSGKSTLLQLVAGLMTPDEGNVIYRGTDIAGFTRSDREKYLLSEVGLVAQSFHLMPTSALNNAAAKLIAAGFSLREAQRLARPWLERVGLSGRMEHTPDELSMGERQRVTIARALVGEPGLLLADEPTGNLDSELSRQVLELLRDIAHERDIPALIVSHDAMATRVVDKTHFLLDGQLYDDCQAVPEHAE